MNIAIKPLHFLIIALTFLCYRQAHAQDWYATADVGVNLLGNQDLDYIDGTGTETASAGFDASFAGGARLGRYVTDNWRIEGEIMYRRNELDAVDFAGFGRFTDGDFASLSYTVSGLYEMPLGASDRWAFYAGAGVSFIQEIDIDFDVAGAETSFETDDIGVQLQVGVRYDVGERWFVDAGARYLIADNIEMVFPEDTSRTVTSDYNPVTLSVGFGWRFGK